MYLVHVARYYFELVILSLLCYVYTSVYIYIYKRKISGRHRCRGAQWPPGCWHSAVYICSVYICTHIVSTLKPEFRAIAKFNMVTVWRSPKTLFAVILPHTRPPAIPLSKYNNPSARPQFRFRFDTIFSCFTVEPV